MFNKNEGVRKRAEREIVIQAENLGVSFIRGYQSDDYKSHLLNLFKKNKNEKKSNRKDGDFWPIRHLDFTGYKGEILGIIGSNGSGKTTICKMLSSILEPDEGSLYINGKVSALFSLGMGFDKELTGRENAYLNGMMLGIRKTQMNEFINEIHEFSGLGEFLDRPIKTYSSGMKARLGFSVAAFMEPEILILDEALNTGDAAFGQKAAEKMKELVSKAKMVILVTHSLKYAQKNCDRLIWLDKGVIKAEGEPKEVASKYKASVPERKLRRNKRLNIEKTHVDIKEKSIVKAHNVGVSYKVNKDEFWALKGNSFEIKEGEVVGIIGHNGAGKSTLCKLMTNILTPDEGNLELEGETTALLGYGTGFNSQLTGVDNIYLNGMLLGMSKKKIDHDYNKIVEFSNLKHVIDKPIKQYSSGMRARLGFSIAATLKPDIFILDEALSTGDIAFKQKASEKIQDMMEGAKAVIIVSHSMSFVEKICTRAIWMDQGRIIYDGEPQKAIELYRNKYNVKKKIKKIKKKKR
ncbi:ATP-binding cassette domain-containing protein [Salipaludibacillus sp. LMS25]|jgi:teichoic acid transport system ATP-binding protein|uniref:ABC transporter ATP-binding protein n=1 Tax=Salipaludibacillus sp. LMS25 TaxID=2924031 RepID=UPI0020D090BF|nr:ATP-binding cassette domain-containing protein [Salipaludibacillus sp. LMS25]UTR16215.1 ATP-binding cassette domain-containing protein [Salipaludibacillus sp. LMS25]